MTATQRLIKDIISAFTESQEHRAHRNKCVMLARLIVNNKGDEKATEALWHRFKNA